MFEKVLCAIDGSHAADRAVEFAIGLAQKFEAELRFITVSTVSRESAARSPFWDTQLFDAGEQLIARELGEAMAAAKKANLSNVSSVTVTGRDIAAAIVGYAQENGYDHIVMGSTGHSSLGRLLIGSIVDDVLDRPHPPVTVV